MNSVFAGPGEVAAVGDQPLNGGLACLQNRPPGRERPLRASRCVDARYQVPVDGTTELIHPDLSLSPLKPRPYGRFLALGPFRRLLHCTAYPKVSRIKHRIKQLLSRLGPDCFWVCDRARPSACQLQLVAGADDVPAVELGIALGELDALVGAPRLAPLQREAGDQARERIGVVEQPLEALGAAQRARPGARPPRGSRPVGGSKRQDGGLGAARRRLGLSADCGGRGAARRTRSTR